MKFIRVILFVFLQLGCFTWLKSQDKIFLRNGQIINASIISLDELGVSYKDTVQNSPIIKLKREDVLLTEDRNGKIYMYSILQPKNSSAIDIKSIATEPTKLETRSERRERLLKEWKVKENELSNNILGFYIPELLFGRLTVSYERLLANKSIGILIPVSLTYDGLGALAEFSANNSNNNSINSGTNTSNTTTAPVRKRNVGTGVIAGVDVNYYYDLKPRLKYFFGPRVRYGTDMTLGGIEGLTVQIQNGIFSSRGKNRVSALSFGFGFFKLSDRYSRSGLDTKQVYPWASFTWRLGFRL